MERSSSSSEGRWRTCGWAWRAAMADELDEGALTAIAAMLDGCPTAGFRMRLRQTLERSISMTTSSIVHPRGVRAGFMTVTPYLMAPDIEPVIAFAKHV